MSAAAAGAAPAAAATAADPGGESLPDRLRRLAALWRAVTSRPVHPVGCTCMGHFLIPALDPRDMEADILDFMRGRYAEEGLAAIVALLDARAAARDSTDIPAPPFRGWLLDLPRNGADPAALDRFVTDLIDTLLSFGADPGPTGEGSGVFCI